MMRRFGFFLLVLALWSGAALRDGLDRWVETTELPVTLSETSVEVRDNAGRLLRVFPVEQGRIRMALRLEEVDPDFIDMLVAFEDKRFYRHAGVDPLAALRAAGQALLNGRIVAGGSTLTMQVARLLENSGTGRWQGKLRQVRVALALERRLSKEQILTLYLTHAPYGGPVEGLRAGTRAWFGKDPGRLTRAEAALLIALPQSPETRRPDRHPQAAQAAQARVLARLGEAADGQGARVPQTMLPFPRLAPHLADRLRSEDPLTGHFDLTLQAPLQDRMEQLARRATEGQARGVSAAILVADHQSGAVLAHVGAPIYGADQGMPGFVDMVGGVRSPGSTLKPLIYGLAFDHGLAHPDTLIRDAPVAFGRYAPQNFDGLFRGDVTVREALQLSLNIPPVLLTEELGPARLMAALRRAGTDPKLPGGEPGLAVALGGLGMTLADLVRLYGGIARGGTEMPLHWLQGATAPPPRRIVSPVAAWQVSHILASIAPPRGRALRGGAIAYKTGTSYGHRDAWAVGFDGRHVVGVWMGRPDGTPMPGAFGGDLAAPLLFEAFGRIKGRPDPLPPPPPDTLILSSAELPLPLQRFRSRGAVFAATLGAPEVRFPPDGATLRPLDGALPLKLREGALPLTVLVNGRALQTGVTSRDIMLPYREEGFATIAVIDAQGRSDRVQIRVMP
ncbi:MAG: penicillin-binding protein 1C [Sulfitobacter sp.]|nr:penicillin-binding protein 1C [Sulfitobacter sp.]